MLVSHARERSGEQSCPLLDASLAVVPNCPKNVRFTVSQRPSAMVIVGEIAAHGNGLNRLNWTVTPIRRRSTA